MWCFSQVKGAVDDDVAEGKTTPSVGRCECNLAKISRVFFFFYVS
uniref:Uncharacterized protein n=1 Tax=Strix occidentalis caurina TaxID=311401 RepID=A0A8D0EN38_STROC